MGSSLVVGGWVGVADRVQGCRDWDRGTGMVGTGLQGSVKARVFLVQWETPTSGRQRSGWGEVWQEVCTRVRGGRQCGVGERGSLPRGARPVRRARKGAEALGGGGWACAHPHTLHDLVP